MPLDDAMKKFPDFLIFITAHVPLKFAITEELLSHGINQERIVNFEAYRKAKSCPFIEQDLTLRPTFIEYCCQGTRTAKSPRVIFEGDYDSMIENVILRRDMIANDWESSSCNTCVYGIDGYYRTNRVFRHIILGMESDYGHYCNFKCSYCYPDYLGKQWRDAIKSGKIDKNKVLNFSTFIEALQKQGHIDDDAFFEFCGGELPVLPVRNEIMSFLKQYRSRIFTNASVFDKDIAALLSEGKTYIRTSIDAGTRETFFQVKNVDMFEKVCNNVIQYGETGGDVQLKYIFLPGVNDNLDNIRGFIDLCEKAKIKDVHLARDLTTRWADLPDNCLRMMALLARSVRDKGMFAWLNMGITEHDKAKIEEYASHGLSAPIHTGSTDPKSWKDYSEAYSY